MVPRTRCGCRRVPAPRRGDGRSRVGVRAVWRLATLRRATRRTRSGLWWTCPSVTRTASLSVVGRSVVVACSFRGKRNAPARKSGAFRLCGLELPLYSDGSQLKNCVGQHSHCAGHQLVKGRWWAHGRFLRPFDDDHWRLVVARLDQLNGDGLAVQGAAGQVGGLIGHGLHSLLVGFRPSAVLSTPLGALL